MMVPLVLSLLILAIIILMVGAVLQWRRGDRRKAALMTLLALVAAINVGIWTVPDQSGVAPVVKMSDRPG